MVQKLGVQAVQRTGPTELMHGDPEWGRENFRQENNTPNSEKLRTNYKVRKRCEVI